MGKGSIAGVQCACGKGSIPHSDMGKGSIAALVKVIVT